MMRVEPMQRGSVAVERAVAGWLTAGSHAASALWHVLESITANLFDRHHRAVVLGFLLVACYSPSRTQYVSVIHVSEA